MFFILIIVRKVFEVAVFIVLGGVEVNLQVEHFLSLWCWNPLEQLRHILDPLELFCLNFFFNLITAWNLNLKWFMSLHLRDFILSVALISGVLSCIFCSVVGLVLGEDLKFLMLETILALTALFATSTFLVLVVALELGLTLIVVFHCSGQRVNVFLIVASLNSVLVLFMNFVHYVMYRGKAIIWITDRHARLVERLVVK